MEVEKPAEQVAMPKKSKFSVKRPNNLKRIALLTLAGIILLSSGAGAGYFYRDNKAKKTDEISQKEITDLKASVTKLTSDLSEAKKVTTTTTTTTVEPACTDPTITAISNIKASITSGNTATLESYMATNVYVIHATFGGVDARTPAQAVGDIGHVKPGTASWNFSLTAATLNQYKAGHFKHWFPTGAVVGKSGDGFVISFQFDCKGKISGVFMSSDTLF